MSVTVCTLISLVGTLLKKSRLIPSVFLYLQKIDTAAPLLPHSFFSNALWIGVHDAGNNNQFIWIGPNDVVSDDLWIHGAPNHGTPGEPKDCAYVAVGGNSGLHSTVCSGVTNFFCEANVN